MNPGDWADTRRADDLRIEQAKGRSRIPPFPRDPYFDEARNAWNLTLKEPIPEDMTRLLDALK
jgi:hypothetical protein